MCAVETQVKQNTLIRNDETHAETEAVVRMWLVKAAALLSLIRNCRGNSL